MNVCVVGNSPLLLENEHGATIDSYDVVIRCNRFLIKGYEKHVGTRTDYTVLNKVTMSRWYNLVKKEGPLGPIFQSKKIKAETLKGNKETTGTFNEWRNKDCWPQEGVIISKGVRVLPKHQKHRKIIHYISAPRIFAKKHKLRGKDGRLAVLSCGSVAILFAKEYLKAEEVSCYGFTRNYKGKCTHYFEGVSRKVADCHNHERQLQLMIDLYGVKFYE